jgi:hypothetical protein
MMSGRVFLTVLFEENLDNDWRFLNHAMRMQLDTTLDDARLAIRDDAALICTSRHLTTFTCAGISVESGIPPFRGPGGLWSQYDPRMLELDFLLAHPPREGLAGHPGDLLQPLRQGAAQPCS